MSTQVDFYILADNSTEQADHFACRLAEKAYRQGGHLLILTNNAEQTKALDELLWTFRADSFVPHGCNNDKMPVTINHTQSVATSKLLLNLSGNIPGNAQQYERILELVNGTEQQRANARVRYRNYQKLDFTLNTFKF